MVWSALRLMAEKASSDEYAMPDTAARQIEMTTFHTGSMSAGSRFSAIVPTRPPMTIMPSSARLMTPECSEKQPPSATSIRTVAESSAYLSIRNILLHLLSV